MALILLRHTEPLGHAGLCYGQSDLPLGPGFEAEAARIAAALPPVAAVVSSPLSRALRLAEWIGAARGLPVRVDPRLTEMHFGTWEGALWDAVPRAEIDAWAADLMGACPHRGERVRDLAARVAQALEDCAPNTLVVTHMGVVRAAMAWAGAPGPWDAHLGFGAWISLP